ncbi:hypothetical protein CCH79_00000202 [Gambusia affinis]|nr:hypothetical protein CCH79_00000202 [Gambusia affinis]
MNPVNVMRFGASHAYRLVFNGNETLPKRPVCPSLGSGCRLRCAASVTRAGSLRAFTPLRHQPSVDNLWIAYFGTLYRSLPLSPMAGNFINDGALHRMVTDVQLAIFANMLGVSLFLLVVLYHYVAVNNPKKQECLLGDESPQSLGGLGLAARRARTEAFWASYLDWLHKA